MNGKAMKWLQETLLNNYPPYLRLLKPPRLPGHSEDHPDHNNAHRHAHQHPPIRCKPGEKQHAMTGLPRDGDNNNNNNNNNYGTTDTDNLQSNNNNDDDIFPWSRHQGQGQGNTHNAFLQSSSSGFGLLPQQQSSKSHGFGLNPLCSSLLQVQDANNDSSWTNGTEFHKYSLHGKWLGGRGRAWTPPGLEGGEDVAGSNGATDFLEDNLSNATYPDYGYDNYYDYDHSDWLTSHLDEVYDIMRSSQMDTNIGLTVFLAIVFLFGVTGNILVLAVFSRGAAQQQASTVFIKALAVTDLVICLVVLPGVLLKEWYIPYRWDALCQGWELIRCSTIPLSTLILASVAVDRYVKICRVDRSIQISTTTAKKILLATATISVCLGIPPMLRMGVYQAGDGPGNPKIYLGLCMGNDLLVSKETVDRYWQAMAAKFLLVLLVVMVMYGLVFRTVYRQSRRWGRCAAKTSENLSNDVLNCRSRRRGRKGFFNKAYYNNNDGCDENKNEDEEEEEDGYDVECDNNIADADECKNGKNKNGCDDYYRGKAKHCGNENGSMQRLECGGDCCRCCCCCCSVCCCNDETCQFSENCSPGLNSNPKFPEEVCKCRCKEEKLARAGNCTRTNICRDKTRAIKTIQSEKKKSSLSLSFLCGDKRNADIVIETAPAKLLNPKKDDLPDDGVTSLDDGHVSYINAPSSSSQSQTKMEGKKKRPRLAIFSCTSELTVSRSAYVSKKSYYQSSSHEEEEDEDLEMGNKTKLNNKGIMPLPHWLRRWKRLITVALFTSSAQREEEKRSAEKLALRQKAKIKMLNEETSCDTDGNGISSSQQHPDIVIQSMDSTTENTLTSVVNTTETNLATKKRTKLKKLSQSLDQTTAGTRDELIEATVKKDQVDGCDNHNSDIVLTRVHSNTRKSNMERDSRNLQQELVMNKWKSLNPPSAVTLEVSPVNSKILHDVNVDQAVSSNHSVQSRPRINYRLSLDQGVKDSDGKSHNTFFISKVSYDEDNFPNFQDEKRCNSQRTKTIHDGEKESFNISQSSNSSGEGPFQKWLLKHRSQGMAADQIMTDATGKQEHQTILNSISCPLPAKTIIKSKTENSKSRVGHGNKIHPLNSPLFSSSVPDIRVNMESDEKKDHIDVVDSEAGENNRRWVFSRSEYFENSCKSHSLDFDPNLHRRDYALLNTKAGNGLATTMERKDGWRQVIQHGKRSEICHHDIEDKISDANNYLTETFQLSSSNPPKSSAQIQQPNGNEGLQDNDRCVKHKNSYHQHCPQLYQKHSHKVQQTVDQKQSQGRREGGKLKAGGGGNRSEGREAGVKRDPQRRYNGAQVKTAQVLFLVTVVYVLSFAPVLLMSVEAVPPHPIPFYGYFIHSAANPILYSFINEAFRSQLYRLLCSPCGKKR